jgi:outer membrane murein-binding lipoprotein Lpp
MSLTRIPGNQVPVLENNGLMSREWYRFFYNLFQLTGGGSSDVTPAELQAEVDALDAAVSGLATDVNTLDAQVTSLDGSVNALSNQVAAVEDEANYSYLEPANDAGEVQKAIQGAQLSYLTANQDQIQKAIQDAKLSQMESSVNTLATIVQGMSLSPPTFVNSELGIGSFYDTTTVVPAAINTAYAITFDTVVIQNSIYRGSTTSRIYVTNAGVYNFQFSAQLDNTSGGNHAIYIWFRVNGTDIPNSASQVRVQGNNGELLAAWNIFLSMAAGDYFELMYSVEDTAVRILAQAATSPVPAIPSVILTVNQVYSPYGH